MVLLQVGYRQRRIGLDREDRVAAGSAGRDGLVLELQRQGDGEDRSLTGTGRHRDPASVRLDDGRGDGEPEAGTAARPGPRGVASVEALEDPVGILRRKPWAPVG